MKSTYMQEYAAALEPDHPIDIDWERKPAGSPGVVSALGQGRSRSDLLLLLLLLLLLMLFLLLNTILSI